MYRYTKFLVTHWHLGLVCLMFILKGNCAFVKPPSNEIKFYVESPTGICAIDETKKSDSAFPTEEIECAQKIFDYSERYLNGNIKFIISLLNETEEKSLFLKANEKWYEFRNISCEFDSATFGANSKVVEYLSCKERYNLDRIKILDRYKFCLTTEGCATNPRLYYYLPGNN